jgi:hypothetical protein
MQEKQSILPVVFVVAIAALVCLAFFIIQGTPQQEPQTQQVKPVQQTQPARQENQKNPLENPAIQAAQTSKPAAPDMNDSIRVSSPQAGELITSPVVIEGRAKGMWFFEASFPVKITDANNKPLVQGIATTASNWMTPDFVPFKAELKFDAGKNVTGYLVLEKDNPSGLEGYNYNVRIPVTFRRETTATKPLPQNDQPVTVKVFFNNSRLDPNFTQGKVFPVQRVLSRTQAVARGAIEELLKGPSDREKSDDYFTCINPDVKIRKLTIADGIARVDFDGQIQYRLGGSARVGAIRAQITETLKQFPTVKEVIISVNGSVEEALQP